MISTRVHGLLDYSVGLLFVLVPWIFGFAQGGVETIIFVALGMGALLYSLVTNYEWGLFKIIPMRAHLALDCLSGVLLIASPWLFGFADQVYVPHLLFGLFEIAVASMTEKLPMWRKKEVHI